MNDENVPMDVTAEQAKGVIQAAIEWRNKQGRQPILNLEEWHLYEAVNAYGGVFKGLAAR